MSIQQPTVANFSRNRFVPISKTSLSLSLSLSLSENVKKQLRKATGDRI
jgi:hypothetical protein